jgi:hypothetical protein
MQDEIKIIPQIRCKRCGGTEFNKAGKNEGRVICTNPRIVVQVQRWICKNKSPLCRTHNFTLMDGSPVPEKNNNKKSNGGF